MEATPSNETSGQQAQEPREADKIWIEKVKDKIIPGVQITLLISLVFYVAMFGIGIWGFRQCPVEDNIPFFLIVTGGIGLLSKLSSIIREACITTIDNNISVKYVESSLYSVEVVFLILGTFWVFKEYKPSFNPSAGHSYCNKTVYLFAFTYLAVLYGIIFIIIICFACFLGCLYFVKRTERNDQDPESVTRPIRVSTPE